MTHQDLVLANTPALKARLDRLDYLGDRLFEHHHLLVLENLAMHRSLLIWLRLHWLPMSLMSHVIGVALYATAAGMTMSVRAEIRCMRELLRLIKLIYLRNR